MLPTPSHSALLAGSTPTPLRLSPDLSCVKRAHPDGKERQAQNPPLHGHRPRQGPILRNLSAKQASAKRRKAKGGRPDSNRQPLASSCPRSRCMVLEWRRVQLRLDPFYTHLVQRPPPFVPLPYDPRHPWHHLRSLSPPISLPTSSCGRGEEPAEGEG